ncbi:ParA family protein [Streptomyces sp. CSDS2]|uniref:ParA family protein n=1 Tax=Streptomyces sp. CSDS2 TaxID=3055051 RepID=UPI0025B2337D|nr:ParA family protein [Streptomyces sp. CSDS2]MDN3263307.1 ParA family protein [Streptomyces sp. CSDS2]
MAKKIVFAVHKGGAGKTTSAKNIAVALALAGNRTLLVDLDEQANATEGMGVDPGAVPATVNDLFKHAHLEPASALIATYVDGLHLLAGHEDLASTESGMTIQRGDPNAPDPVLALRGILAPLESLYDFIIIDTPPSLKFMTINALAAADELVVPIAASAYNEKGVRSTITAYERAVENYNPSLRLRGLLITRLKPTLASRNVRGIVGERYSHLVLPQLIVESTAVDEAEQIHQSVVLYDPNSAAALGYKRVAEILING